jgi:hypothetical protein|tara:strand:+ start:1342 stop:1764 length:423 start_codon:yes stop_codon:yes gene_type:complete
MIKYNLKCEKSHEFTSWFLDSSEYEKLKNKKLLECIYCLSKKIEKTIMAPMISGIKSKETEADFLNQKITNKKNELLKIRKHIEKNFEFVGDEFSKKVREVYYDRKSKKAIYGTTTLEEREELIEEGIDLLSIPWTSKDN